MAPRFNCDPSLDDARENVFETKKKVGKAEKPLTWADDLPVDIASMRAAIPAHCFVHENWKSFAWLAHDIVLHLGFLYFGARFMLGNALLDNVVGWFLFAIACGTQLTGIWVLGHEAGHGAFHSNKIVNDIVGYACHQYLLVPYFSWQYSHGVHHRRTNHLIEGETHVPNQRHEVVGQSWRFWMARNLPRWFNQVIGVLGLVLVGWPAYILTHATGSKKMREAGANHIKLTPLFPPMWHNRVRLTNAGLAAGLAILAVLGFKFGFATVAKLYVGPWAVTHAWLVFLTHIHHSHPSLPHFRTEGAKAWTWLKGAMCTVDAQYGDLVDWLQHDIGNTHLVHHIFSTMPWYKQREATRHLLAYMQERGVGHLYTYNPRPYASLFDHILTLCYVDDDGDVCFYKSVEEMCAHLDSIEASKGKKNKAA